MAKPCPGRVGSRGMLPREILNIYIEIIPFSALFSRTLLALIPPILSAIFSGILSTFQLVLQAVAMITKCGRACYVSRSEVVCKHHWRVIEYLLVSCKGG